MSQPFLGEIRIFAGNFAPYQWALCNGQLMPISQNTALFSLLGTQYGGNGTSNFALPNFQGMGPMHFGNGAGLTPRSIGQIAGEATVTLIQSQMPAHNHAAVCDLAVGTSSSPVDNIWAENKKGKGAISFYSDVVPGSNAMSPLALALTGGGQPHNNLAPYLVMTFIIALNGIFPSRN